MNIRKLSCGTGIRGLAAAAFLACAALPAAAQSVDTLEIEQNKSQEEFDRVAREMELSQQRQEELAAELAAVKNDNAALTAALIQAVKTERKLSEDIQAIEGRLENLIERENELKTSLRARRGTLAEVLGALQRMGLNPPPAILVRPEDALASVRSAILLGAVVPELRDETAVLVADLQELARIVASIRSERESLESKVAEQAHEKQRLTGLLTEKRRLQDETEALMEEELAKAEDLALRADSLQGLIVSLQTEIESLRAALEERRARQERDAEDAREENGLAEALPFTRRAGLLPLPVAGEFVSYYGEDDGSGSTLKGDILRTQSGAIVTAPADGTVLYAGPFRSYGQLLILDPGDGYHIVLAGMDRLHVSLGQTVLAGEPIGMMGEARLASITTAAAGSAVPELYVEFRKDGKPVDPKLWWARELSGRTGNDT
ncbi:murein hydrolase activator EnvC family protein [Nitratireductor thuwali]|uniref:Murein hydrolase activator EnvC n=1 Tax=Nitratireductor thuwali TaxID=2267699 RepID=A0ABY5MKY2_9HYPH|nr:Murein hydrolase activator EnvC [Nitratireductor thuwali]